MRFGLDVAQHQLTWPELLERVRFAEEAGFDGAWLFDHFKALYGDPTGPCMESWTLLSALAASTERIRLGALVTGMTYRHPSILAAEAVTVDHVSDGRLEFAVGASWFEQEHRELGIPFPLAAERVRRLEEGVEVIRRLMTQDGATYEGEYYQVQDATYRPRPVQQPHPPIWIGGSGERLMLPLIGRQADVWHGFGSTESLARKWTIVARAAEEAGRDPSSIVRSSNLSLSEPWDDVRRSFEALRDAGFTYLVVSWPSEGRARAEEFVTNVLPTLV
ncbi:MAG: TIGR03560 family F420-dependent LLM class oxidoreductase [Actinomycetota bacterium]|nr:TIGR03560 family F420-dependent LLM class oxidoreductase [Actinomycetota bacterium]